jgi:hypothetical protein
VYLVDIILCHLLEKKCDMRHVNVSVGPEKGQFCNECTAALSLGRPLFSDHVATKETAETGCVAAMKTSEMV